MRRAVGRWGHPVIVGALLAVLGPACVAASVSPQKVIPGPSSGGGGSVVVLKSAESAFFEPTIQAFVAAYQGRVVIFSGDAMQNPAALVEAVKAEKPSVVLTLGARASLLARDNLPEATIIFASVLNYRSHALAAGPKMAGISLETRPGTDFLGFKAVLPHLQRVVTFYSPKSSQQLIEDARADLRMLGVELVAVAVDGIDGIVAGFDANTAGVDAVWMVNDLVIMNQEAFGWLRTRCSERKLPLLTSLSEAFAEAGALMSVGVDMSAIGSQAAAMVGMISQGVSTPQELGVQSPVGSKLALNLKTADDLKIEVAAHVRPFIDRVFGSGTAAP